MVHPARFVRIVYADIYRSSICPLQQLGKRCGKTDTAVITGDADRLVPVMNHGSVELADLELQPAGSILQAVGHCIYFQIIPLHYRRNQDVIIGLADIIVLRLPASVIVTARPGSYGPTVVVLPEKRPHIIRHLAAVRLDGRLDGISLQHMVHIKKCPEITRFFIFIQQVSLNQPVGMVATTLMGHHHLGTYIPVFGVRSIALDGLELWKRLKTVLAEKAGFLAVIIRNGCFTMPDTPIVTVPVSSTGHLSLECERRRRPIEGSGCILPDHPG